MNCYCSLMMSVSSKCEKRRWPTSRSSLTSHCSLAVCSFLSYRYLLFLKKSCGRKSPHYKFPYDCMHPCFLFHTFVSVFASDKNTSVPKLSTSLCSNQQLLSMKEKLIIFLTNSRKQHFTIQHPWTRKAKGKKLVRKEQKIETSISLCQSLQCTHT